MLDDEGDVVARAPGFEECLLVCDVDPTAVIGRRLRDVRRRALARERGEAPSPRVVELPAPREQDGKAAPEPVALRWRSSSRCGSRSSSVSRDYVGKNGFGDVVVGVSGGIDSALTAALAAEALGPERVHCVSMPSRYSSEGTRSDARRLAENLGCDFLELAIEPLVEAFADALAPHFAGLEPDLAEENLQARIRGMLLMALSNKFGWLVVATGNKSELSVGYATLYGDMAGGFALLKDVFKTDVFRLSRHLNERAGRELIPGVDHRARAERGAARRPARRGLAAAVLRRSTGCSRPTSSSTARARSSSGRLRAGRRRARARDDRPRRVQAPAGAARREAPPEGVRA